MNMLRQKDCTMIPERTIRFVDDLRAWLSGASRFPDFAFADSKIEIETTDTEVILSMPAPGCAKGDFEIGLTNDSAVIGVHRETEKANSGGRRIRRERDLQSFEEQVRLPVAVVPSAARADYVDGVLKIVAPREKSIPQEHRVIRIANE